MKKALKVLQNISLDLKYGETLGVVGESGCGKSTLGKSILRLHSITSGNIIFKGKDITHWKFSQLRTYSTSHANGFPRSLFFPKSSSPSILQTLIEPILVHKLCSKKESYEFRVG